MGLSHDVIICTRNRPRELAGCLASLAEQTAKPGTVWVIDASDEGSAAEVADVAARAGVHVIVERTAPSTSAQRNRGVAESTADVVHFLDDDTVVAPEYVASILAVFADDEGSTILGVGGVPTNLVIKRPSRLQGLLLPGSTRPGAVLASGRGVLAGCLRGRTDVDWLSGCCMSFRREVLLVEQFDETGVGYVLGEDLELSYRIRQHGRLVVEPAARLVHLESPRNRWDLRRWARTDVINRRRRVESGIGSYRVSAFWFDAICQLVLWTLRSIRPGASDARAMVAGLVSGLVATRAAAPTRHHRERIAT